METKLVRCLPTLIEEEIIGFRKTLKLVAVPPGDIAVRVCEDCRDHRLWDMSRTGQACSGSAVRSTEYLQNFVFVMKLLHSFCNYVVWGLRANSPSLTNLSFNLAHFSALCCNLGDGYVQCT
jgi:hypothetical protein